jgi:DTW domain-containing protein YfiP
LQTKVCLIIHHRELKRTTNTGTLALKALSNSELFIRGKINEALDLGLLLLAGNYQSLLFYPSDESIELTSEYLQQFSKPIQLIVPDGNWRQASKVHSRHPELINIPRVMIKSPNQALQHLRAETATRPEGMATLQAIAEALGIIEGPLVKEALLSLYNKKLEATLIGRGQKLKITPCQNS